MYITIKYDNMDLLAILGLIGTLITIYTFLNLKEKICLKREQKEICKRKKYYDTISSKEFLNWQNGIILKIYGKEFILDILAHQYPLKLFNSIDIDYSKFGEFAPITNLTIPPTFEDVIYDNEIKNEYRNILKPIIKYPKRLGYMMDEMIIENNKIKGIKAFVGTYEQTDFTSLILNFEFYKAYLKLKKIPEPSLNIIWENLPLRAEIHGVSGTEIKRSIDDIIIKSHKYNAMIGIQAIVTYYDKDKNDYVIPIIKRNKDASSAFPGFYQIVPSGCFDAFLSENMITPNNLKDNYSLELAVLREYSEELFNAKLNDVKEAKAGIWSIENNSHVKHLKKLLTTKKASFKLIGASIELISFTTELNFLIVIKDKKYLDIDFESNYEADDDGIQWCRLSDLPNLVSDNSIFCQGSAAIYSQAIQYLKNDNS